MHNAELRWRLGESPAARNLTNLIKSNKTAGNMESMESVESLESVNFFQE